MTLKLKLCMIGAGRHASGNVYPSFSFIKGAEVVANCDLNLERAQTIGRQFGKTYLQMGGSVRWVPVLWILRQ
ncbi:hypothetical protein D3C85_1394030 [compost metagenome]